MRHEVVKATAWGIGVTSVLAALIVAGSRNLEHFDAALVAYTFAILFATFGLTYRYAMWLQRPPTAMYWKRGWQAFFQRGFRGRNLVSWVRRVVADVMGNRFILRRDRLRGLAHLLIMWGCVLAALITFPLVFGWLYFRPVPGDLELYRVIVFGFPTITFPIESIQAELTFHGLVWASFLVIAGVMLAMRRRMREAGAAALQRFTEDFVPLVLLFAVSLTGLMLTASYTWMEGYAYEFIAILHAITVIATFIWLPFGKFFHIFQRPAQLGVSFYKDVGREGEPAHCRRCGEPFTSRMHVEDLIEVEGQLGYSYEMVGEKATGEEVAHEEVTGGIEHYQWICPPCRRASVALAQGSMWAASRGAGRQAGRPEGGRPGRPPTPRHVNPGLDEGPLGEEDADNFYP